MQSFEAILAKKNKGSLKIYLGYAPGVGKTYAMLREGHILKDRGLDVVVGYIEPHSRPDTQNLVTGLEAIPHALIEVGSRKFHEMDLAAICKRKPKIVLVDELAHTNLEGSQNLKRYQDVLEILEAGISVITTLNIQHLESVSYRIKDVIQVPVHERIPDKILQLADQIVMVDVSMEELRERLRLGKIYSFERAETALQNFFNYKNLAYLRELTLREVASSQYRQTEGMKFFPTDRAEQPEEPVMVAISSDPTSAQTLIRKGARLAAQLSSRLYVVYVQKRAEDPLKINTDLQRKLQANFALCHSLGGELVKLQGERISDVLVNFAQEKRIKHAVFGKSRVTLLWERIRGSILLAFIHDSVGVNVHVLTTTEVDTL